MSYIISLNDIESKNNKVTSIHSTSTNEEYPSAKAVYDALSTVTPPYG